MQIFKKMGFQKHEIESMNTEIDFTYGPKTVLKIGFW